MASLRASHNRAVGMEQHIQFQQNDEYKLLVKELDADVRNSIQKKPFVRFVYNNTKRLKLLQSLLVIATIIMVIVMLSKKQYSDMLYAFIPAGLAIMIGLSMSYMEKITKISQRKNDIYNKVYRRGE